jgi:hypothetical protein
VSAQAVGWVWTHSPYKGATLLVQLAIADSVNDQNENELWMSLVKLSRKARVDRVTARLALRTMVRDGLLLVVQEPGRETPGRYRFMMPDRGGEPVTTPQTRGGEPVTTEVVNHSPGGWSVTHQGGGEPLTTIPKEIPSRTQGTTQLPPVKTPPSDFGAFWAAYPRKTAKADALKAWQQVRPPLPAVLATLAWQRQQPDWLRDQGAFVPFPASWLRGRRWEDEPPEVKPAFTTAATAGNAAALAGALAALDGGGR